MAPKKGSKATRTFDPRKTSELEQYLRSQIDIVKIISEHVDLTKKGQHYEGRCPFHPSDVYKDIAVYPNKQRFLCMSSGCSHGDVFDFIAKLHSISRSEAMQLLADKVGIVTQLFKEIPLDETKGEFQVNFSMLKLFRQCPLRYKYRYIDKKRDQRTTSYLALGRIVHNTLADFFRLDISQRLLTVLLDLLEQRWKSYKFPDKEEEQQLKIQAEQMLTTYFRNHDCNVKIWRVEAPIKCKVNGLAIVGTVDRIDESPEGGYAVIEYKTEPVDSTEDNKIQLALYYHGVLQAYNLAVSKLILEYLPSQRTISIDPSEEALDSYIAKAYKIVKQIQETNDFRPKRNRYCMDCVLAPTCPEYKKSSLSSIR